ncbi:DUF5996 family protein [Gordonia sp. CPCC 205515]|uniref:DUF5996 family protein n=1 Tax=Gordonia sp. CPCC 205515 TaxID=3140791 RepID=UPI003AF3F043
MVSPTFPWPALTVDSWTDTRETLHMWTQIVGKVRMALSPHVNHWWGTTLYVDARGLTTGLMPVDDGGLEIRFDFIAHELILQHTDGRARSIQLGPRSVADFYRDVRADLDALGVHVQIYPVPVELPEVIPFADDETHHSYDPQAVHTFWQQLVVITEVFSEFRARFTGKVSPSHFFWGAFDLAVTRFSGRAAPQHPGGVPNCPDSVMHEAYDSELSSAGFWCGGGEEGAFYSYAYPEPDGFRSTPITVSGARYDEQLGEFILPYETARTSSNPAATVLDFLEQTYRAAADTGGWPAGLAE